MLGHIASSRAERQETFFRYSVKCDRLTATRIEIAARKAGLTVNAFVQQHFDTILDAKSAALRQAQVKDAPRFDRKRFDAIGFARRHKVSIPAARVWAALAGRVDAEGRGRATLLQLARDADVDGTYPGLLLKALAEAGMVEVIEPSRSGRPGLYRIIWED
ncbi:hypothetical protein [Allomesorhizobium alhagi]|uniref:Uncharacterized protein n=1 Tax=Mesorhizobium alhagi CCNWXJ12-2 TaxID=1107882 RepID=H0HQX4_9HYPH|nr:hypothetical protein [Mesorhizobium alhagi]EHK56836.1 hypothetical protein MAXJ12_12782 [Mesorhizobium alhagi CCNWXJ12-2]